MTLGILGGGQLGRMLALAAAPLGLRTRVYEPASESPAAQVADRVQGAFDDLAALESFASGLDRITYEFENVPVETVRGLAQRHLVWPPVEALEVAQDRWREKSFFQGHGILVPPCELVESEAQLETALEKLGCPAVLKTRRLGYDGKGQFLLREQGDTARAWAGVGGAPSVLEGFVPFDRELSLIAVRSINGETAFYPLVENLHRHGILHWSMAPAPAVSAELQTRAEEQARAIMESLGYVGVLAIEFFDLGGTLLANEMAPRVHNSGHWTIEGAVTSQFENHLRAIYGWPLGDTRPTGHSLMINLVGHAPAIETLLAIREAHAHLYGKTPRAGRKLGHVTRVRDRPWSPDEVAGALKQVSGQDTA